MRIYASLSSAVEGTEPRVQVDESNGKARLSFHLSNDLYIAMDSQYAEKLVIALSQGIGRATVLDEQIFDKAVTEE